MVAPSQPGLNSLIAQMALGSLGQGHLVEQALKPTAVLAEESCEHYILHKHFLHSLF